MSDPYKVETPFVVSFSGGRTSAFMLHNIMQAHGGIPEGSHVVFANTGKEHEGTLRFVEDVALNWKIPIVWVERMFREEEQVRVVNFETASRAGEPFAKLIAKKKFLPNSFMRFCTEELKVRAISWYLRSLGMTEGTMVIGLRFDEPRRFHKVQGTVRLGYDYDCPIYRAGHTLEDVLAFWKQQSFDLKLPNDDRAFGNCDLCFLKGRKILNRVMQHSPELTNWWIEQEGIAKGRFAKDRPTYETMLHQIRIQPELFPPEDDGESTISCLCTD
jgi:hypothetical protein